MDDDNINSYFEHTISNLLLDNLFRTTPYFLDDCPALKLGDFLLYQYCVHDLHKKLLPINIQNKNAIRNSLLEALKNYISKHVTLYEKA